MLEDVHVGRVSRVPTRSRPELLLSEAHLVQHLLGQPVGAVRPRLWVREAAADSLDAPALALYVARGPMVPLMRSRRDPYAVARLERHASLASSSPGASTPFSTRIVSAAKSQRS